MVGAVLLTAYKNCGGYEERGGREAFEEALEEMRARGSEYPGGACGLWGCCGAAVSTGIFMSIITKATPLTGNSWRLSNEMTSRALGAVARLGGPRCCKRDSARGDYVRLFRRESAVFEEALSILQVYLGFFMEPKDETGWES